MLSNGTTIVENGQAPSGGLTKAVQVLNETKFISNCRNWYGEANPHITDEQYGNLYHKLMDYRCQSSYSDEDWLLSHETFTTPEMSAEETIMEAVLQHCEFCNRTMLPDWYNNLAV